METARLISRKNNLDLWEAWVDIQVIGSKPFATLYVLGEVPTSGGKVPSLMKKKHQGDPRVLSLELTSPILADDDTTEELYYYEILPDVYQYERVLIFDNIEMVANIDIEVIND